MLSRLAVALVTLTAITAAGANPPSAYPDDPAAALALYEQTRKALNPVYIPSSIADLQPATHVGHVLELQARFMGRISVNADDATRRRILFRFELQGGKCVYAASAAEVSGLPTNEDVRVILDVPPAEPGQARFRLCAIVREADVPPEPTPGAAPVAANVAPPADAALPPELREAVYTLPALAPLPATARKGPRPGVEGAWDPANGLGVPVIEQSRLDPWIAWIRKQNPKLTREQADWIARWVIYYSAAFGVDHRLMFAMIKCESDFDPFCVSSAGAVGLTQLMPCNISGLGVVNKWNVQDQIRAGIQYFADMLNMWKGRSNYEQFALAAASYNAGPNRVKQAGGIPNITETKNYVRRMGDLFYNLWQAGFP